MTELDAEHRDQLAEALRRHEDVGADGSAPPGAGRPFFCICGAPIGPYDEGMDDRHRAHVADALAPLVAGWLAEVEERARFNDEVRRQQIRAARADAWDEGHRTYWRRGPDNCRCSAWNSSECGCGEYGNGELLSLNDNPYRGGDDDKPRKDGEDG